MIDPPYLPDEEARLKALLDYKITAESKADPSFDHLINLAAQLFFVPISTLTIVERGTQFHYAKKGLQASQGVRTLGDQLVTAAVAPDGLVEAIERPGDSFAVGVQWHPEMFGSGEQSVGRLFEVFVSAALSS